MRLIKPISSPKPLFFRLCRRYLSLGVDESFVSQVVRILELPETEWDIERLQTLLFSDSETSSSPNRLVHVARRLDSSSKALKFFDHVEANSADSESLSSAFQGVLELASREPNWEKRLFELYTMSKERHVSLTVNSLTLLIGCFGRAGMREELLAVYEGLEVSCKNTHVCNRMVEVLLRLGCFENALQVLDEMIESMPHRFPPNEATGQIVFPWLLKRNEIGTYLNDEAVVRLVSRFGGHGVFPDPSMLTRLITYFCLDKKIDHAWDVLNIVVDSGGLVEAACCNALLTVLSKRNDLERMNKLMVKMKEKDIKPSVVTFSILINRLCKSRKIDAALEIFDKMREGDLVNPDVVTYNTLIDGLCKVGRQEKGLILMEEMTTSEDQRCKPNTVTYNCLIDGFSKVGEINKAMRLYDRMKQENVKPNVVTLNILVDGMCKNRKVNAALVLFIEMQRDGVKGNSFTYSSLISAFCNVNNIKQATELFDQMSRDGCTVDAVVYYNLISGLCKAGRMSDASDVVTKLKDAGFTLDILTYNVLVNGFCRTNKFDKAHETIREMEETGIEPDCVTFNTLIAHLSKTGDLESAHEILKRMLEIGLVPTVYTYGALIHGYCIIDNINEAIKLLGNMASKSKLRPNTVMYNIVINALCKNGVERALSLMDDMRSTQRLKPNTTTYNSLLKGLREANMLDKALEVMDQMVEDGCVPDYITIEIVTEWLSSAGKIDKLRQFLRGDEVSDNVA